MHADVFFRTGSTHRVCQDYAEVGEPDSRVLAALSDGCSSSPHTDFGARFLVRAAHEAESGFEIACAAEGMRTSARLHRYCLDATLLLAREVTLRVSNDDPSCGTEVGVEVAIYGDGVVVAKQRSGTLVTLEIEFAEESPAYLSYLLSESRTREYQRRGLGKRTVRCGGLEHVEHVDLEGRIAYEHRFSAADYEAVYLLSDGAKSFCKTGETGAVESVSLADVAAEVAAARNYNGDFVTRRCQRFLKDAEKRGWRHLDDFSVAGIYMGPQASARAESES